MSFFKKLFGHQSGVPAQPDAPTGPTAAGGLSAPDPPPEAASDWYVTKPNVVVQADDAPAQGELYDFPGDYAQSFDGVDPGGDSPTGGVETHPDFVWLPTNNPQGDESGGSSPPNVLTEGEPPSEAGETTAAFSLGGQEIASFSELQGITTEIKEIDYIEPSDDTDILKQLPHDPAAPDLGSWSKAAGLDTTLEVPDYKAPDSSDSAKPEDINSPLAGGQSGPGIYRSRDGGQTFTPDSEDATDHEAPEGKATLLDLSIEAVQPRPIDPPPVEADSETEIGDLDDLL